MHLLRFNANPSGAKSRRAVSNASAACSGSTTMYTSSRYETTRACGSRKRTAAANCSSGSAIPTAKSAGLSGQPWSTPRVLRMAFPPASS